MYELKLWDDPILRLRSEASVCPSEDLEGKAALMVRAMQELNGVGLAANQIGFEDRMFVYQVHEQADPIAFVNPQIIDCGFPKVKMGEGCLSIPGYEFLVTRYTSVTVRAQDLSGNWFTIEAREPLAQIFQHEIDHLNGIRILDRISSTDKKRALKVLKQSKPI